MKKSKFFILCLALSLGLMGCGGGNRSLPTSDEYPVMEVGVSGAATQTTYPAVIKGIQDVEVRPKVSGFITKVYVQEGQRVAAGQILFAIDNTLYQSAVRQAEAQVVAAKSGVSRAEAGVVQANAALNSANAQASTAQLTYENSKNLHANKVIGDYELQSARNNYETAQAAVSQARSGVAAAVAGVKQAQASVKQAEAGLISAKENLSYCYVKSPSDGLVGSLPFKEGALVSPSSVMALTTISNVSMMEVYFSMTESDMLQLTRQNNGLSNALQSFPSVRLKLSDGTIYNHEGTIVKTTGMIDAATGTMNVIARFTNPEHLLKSGGSGSIIIEKRDNRALQIPQDAVIQIQNKMFVYKVKADNHVAYTEIKVKAQNDGINYVVTEGLKVGDKIVTKGINTMQDGMKIKPLTPQEYEQVLKKAAELGKNQSSASGFLKAMKGEK